MVGRAPPHRLHLPASLTWLLQRLTGTSSTESGETVREHVCYQILMTNLVSLYTVINIFGAIWVKVWFKRC